SRLATGDGIVLEQILHRVKEGGVNDRLVLAGEPFSLVAHLAEAGPVLEQVGERTVGQSHSARIAPGRIGSPLRNDRLSIELGFEPAQTFKVEIASIDEANGVGFGLVDYQLLVLD